MIFKTKDRRSVGATSGSRHFTKIRTDKPANGLAAKMTNSQTEAAYDLMGSTFRLGPVRMILLAEISRLAGRIFPCIHIRHFIPLAEMNSKFFLLAQAKRVHFSHTAQQLGDVGVSLYLFARKRIALIINIFDTITQYQHKS